MEEKERKYLIKALYEFAWKIAELESGAQLKKLPKKEQQFYFHLITCLK